MYRVKSVTACPAYTLEIEFEDGLSSTLSNFGRASRGGVTLSKCTNGS